MSADVPDVLARICADTRAETARRKKAMDTGALRDAIAEIGDTPRGFAAALGQKVAEGGYGLIAEIKKASPSGGMIRPTFDPADLARAYESAGAACLSVLTDAPWFQGSVGDLKAARGAVKLPVLRKDFILEPWQVYESRAIGADCILLILAALTDGEALELEALARSLDMDVLAEVHDEAELNRALGLQTHLIGINNRNLRTLRTELATTLELAPSVPLDRTVVSESGIGRHEDVRHLADAGARCFLVGESLLRQADVGQAARALLGRP